MDSNKRIVDTNIRIIDKGDSLFLIARKVTISKNDLPVDQLHSICTILKKRNVTASPYNENGMYFLLTEHKDFLDNVRIDLESNGNKGTQFNVVLQSLNETIKLNVKNKIERRIIEELYQKRAQINILNTKDLKIINKSPNVYFDTTPLPMEEDSESDIIAYQRYFVFTEYFEGVGLGFGVDIGTSYFTRYSLEWYFNNGKKDRFFNLKERQSTEYKGTLLYKGPNGSSRCYYDRYDGLTKLINTDPFTFRGIRYENSYDYFRKMYPNFEVSPNDNVAYVSFKGMGTLPVPAKYLFLTVSNENLTDEVNQQDKYTAQQKRNLIDGFWRRVGNPFGANYQKLRNEYYLPDEKNGGTFDMPAIIYADGRELTAPKYKNGYIYKKYFLNKYYKLKENGCYYVPPTLERDIHFIFPSSLTENNKNRLIEDLTKEVTSLTAKSVEPIDHVYDKDEHLSVIYQLKTNYEKGTVVFVFDTNEPSMYYTISQELQGWKIIRLTKQELSRKFNKLNNHPKGKSYWETYISLNAFKVVSELGCIPYMFEGELNYEAQLVIDVSENFSHFGLGLLIFNKKMTRPIFDYIIKPNPDSRNDLINSAMLEKYLLELLSKHLVTFNKYDINKLLVLRDGKENSSEYEIFAKVINMLKTQRPRSTILLSPNFDFLFIEYHKKSLKSIRLFESINGNIHNPLEGSWLRINTSTAILMNTGVGTLTQGTSSPILIKSNYKEIDLIPVLKDIFLTSQLNFGSPRVAQKLTYLAKRIDDLLKERRAQEVIKLK